MFPAFDFFIERISRTGSVHHLSVPLHGVVGFQSPPTDSAGCQLLSHQLHGMLGGQPGHVVSNERNTIAYGVVSEGVGSLSVPASALVDVPVGACDKALGAQSMFHICVFDMWKRSNTWLTFTCILCHPSPCPPGGSAALSACLQSTARRSGRADSACGCGGCTRRREEE